MLTYEDLTPSEKELLKKYPVYVSLLAATYHNHGMDSKEKQTAIEFIHVKSFHSVPELTAFYDDAEKDFEKNLVLLNQQLPQEKKARETKIQEEIVKIEHIVKSMDGDFAAALHKSMEAFREHVSNSHQSLVEYFVFPIPIKGLTY